MEQGSSVFPNFFDYSYRKEEERGRKESEGMLPKESGYPYMKEEERSRGEQGRPPLPYFMSYPYMEMNVGNSEGDKDREYFRQMYPQIVKRYIRVIIEVLDRLDIKESYIYDEYPDKVSLDRLAETILGLIPLENKVPRETQRNIVKVLLYEEVVRRRNRR